ncbi:MAG: glycosyltransferase family 9 protein [bacterium]
MLPERILVIQTAFLGDAILTLPMIQKLSEKYPSSSIDVISIPSTQEIFSASPYVQNVLVLDKRGKHRSIRTLLKFTREIKAIGYSKLFSPHRSFRSSLITMLSGVRNTNGFDTASFNHVYKNLIKYEPSDHEVKRNLSLLGINEEFDWRIKPEIKLSKEVENKIQSFLLEKNLTKKIAVAPGSVWNTKKYPFDYWKEIIGYLVDNSYNVFLIGGSDDTEINDSLKSNFPKGVISTAGQFSIIESIGLLKECMCLICNDSAPTHMGMAADIPVLTIYCSTIPQFGFYPYNKKSVSAGLNDLKCKPCGIHGYNECPIHTFDCGKLLKPSIVIDALKEILSS